MTDAQDAFARIAAVLAGANLHEHPDVKADLARVGEALDPTQAAREYVFDGTEWVWQDVLTPEELLRKAQETAWIEGYEACKRGEQKHSPYREEPHL